MSLEMSKPVRASLLAVAAILLVFALSITVACAQSVFAKREQVIYEGDPIDPAIVKLGSWGSGYAEESTQNAYIGTRSLKVSPKDLYAGGRLDFLVPLDLTQSFKLADAYLQFVILLAGTQANQDQLSLGGQSVSDIYGGTYVLGRQVRTIRLLLFLEDGPVVECLTEVSWYKLQDDGWMVLSIPMATLKGKTELAQYRVTRIVLTADGNEPFHIGEIRTMRDSIPLSVDAGGEKEVSKNYSIAFQAFANSGASPVKYSWDFDKFDGIQEEAVGDLVYHRFTRAGNFEVTVTAADPFGVKQSATNTIKVKVNE